MKRKNFGGQVRGGGVDNYFLIFGLKYVFLPLTTHVEQQCRRATIFVMFGTHSYPTITSSPIYKNGHTS